MLVKKIDVFRRYYLQHLVNGWIDRLRRNQRWFQILAAGYLNPGGGAGFRFGLECEVLMRPIYGNDQ